MKRFEPFIFIAAFIVLFLPALPAPAGVCDEPVDTEQGPVAGLSVNEGKACSYRGVPFAAPPVGELRWKAPQPPAARDTLFPADSFGAKCMQGEDDSFVMRGEDPLPRSEDCLYLNIWRPSEAGTYPVMVWIHGGSLTTGSGSYGLYRGDRLAPAGKVVVVSINYRLGPFGFLAHPALSEEDPHGSSGNYGLLDQVQALRWVKNNIASFGGDPDRVTIFGESAGGWSVCNLLASPPADGLFHRAVIESGGCNTVTSLEKGYKHGRKLARNLDCAGEDELSCLRSKPALEIQENKSVKEDSGDLLNLDDMGFTWIPHLDGYALEQFPIQAIRSGEYNRVPLMVGSNRDEAKLFTLTMPGIRLAPKSLIRWFVKDSGGEDLLPGIEQHYPYRDYNRPADAVIDALGDAMLGCKCYQAVQAAAPQQDVYYYRFDYDRHFLPDMAGACHAFEIPFIFNTMDRPPVSNFMSNYHIKKANGLSRTMTDYWSNFAYKGDPNGEGLKEWPAYNPDTMQRMLLDDPLNVRTTGNREKCRFWEEQNISMD
ncbi:MAG: carboxylesterase/lipase family protein [bacterium]